MAKDFKLEGAKEYSDILNSLGYKVKGQILKSANRSVLSKNITKQLRSSLPYSQQTTKEIRVGAERGSPTAVLVGPTTKSYWLRFVERGTKERIGRGKITASPKIEPYVDSRVNKVIDFTNKEYGKIIEGIIKKKIKRIK